MADPGQWSAATPAAAQEWLRSVRARWWIAGGWALDLYLGRQTREHTDLDVSCFRADFGALRAALDSWEFHVASEGTLRRLAAGDGLRAEDHVLWCRPVGAPQWTLEIMLEDRDGADWVFRRDPAIRRAADDLVLATEAGVTFLRPEVQLLYKAKAPRPRDHDDLKAVLPRLDRAAVEWLRRALVRAHPGHPWIVAGERAAP